MQRVVILLSWPILGAVLFGHLPSRFIQDGPAITSQPVGEEAYQLLSRFYDYDRDVPLEARVVEKQELPNCVREKITFRVRDSWVVGYLGIPKAGSAPYPCVLELHGLSGDKTNWWKDDSYISGGMLTNALIEAGIAVFTPDAQYHGERTSNNGFEPPGALFFKNRLLHATHRGRDMFMQCVVECRRAIDYLETRHEVNVERIGVVGYSMGGAETFAVTALDARARAAVACVAVDLSDPLTAPHNFARALGNRPFLMQMGRKDPLYTVEQAQRLYDLIPGSKKEIVFYDSDHRLPPEYVTKAAGWLKVGLK